MKNYEDSAERTLQISRESKIIIQEYAFNDKELEVADYRTIRRALAFFTSMAKDLNLVKDKPPDYKPEDSDHEEVEVILMWKEELNKHNIDLGAIEGVKNALDQLLYEKNPPRMLLVKSLETLDKFITLMRNFK